MVYYPRTVTERIAMKLSRHTSRVIWIVISIIAVLGMIAFTLLPVIYSI